MKFHNHFDLEAIADDFAKPNLEEAYQAIYTCDIELISNTHFTVFVQEPLVQPLNFVEAFQQVYGVEYAKKRNRFEMDIFLEVPTFLPLDFVQELHRAYDETMEQIRANENQYPLPIVSAKPIQEVIGVANEVLDLKGLVAEENVLYNYYRKIKRGAEHFVLHPFYTGCRMADMAELNSEVQSKIPA